MTEKEKIEQIVDNKRFQKDIGLGELNNSGFVDTQLEFQQAQKLLTDLKIKAIELKIKSNDVYAIDTAELIRSTTLQLQQSFDRIKHEFVKIQLSITDDWR